MYFQESERLAAEEPGLERVIRQVDGVLQTLGPGSIVCVETLSKRLQHKASQIEAILVELEKSGLLHSEQMVQCPDCENLMPAADYAAAVDDEDNFLCSQCGLDLGKQECDEVAVYRQQPLLNEEPQLGSENRARVQEIKESSPAQSLPHGFAENPFRTTPLLHYYSRDPDLLEAKPFQGVRAIVVLHFLRDLIPFMEAIFRLGQNPKNVTLFYKAYPYPQREAVTTYLMERGCEVLPVSQIPQHLANLDQVSDEQAGPILIVEDGGLCVPMIHRAYPSLRSRVVGAVEQTTRGVMNIQDWLSEDGSRQLAFPFLSVAGSNLKAEFEPRYIAEAVVANIHKMLPDIALKGKQVGLFGYGAIGRQIGQWLLRNGANVTVYEPDKEKALVAQQEGGINLAESPKEAASGKHYIIGASGRQSVDADVISSLRQDCYLMSASSEQYEIDLGELHRLAQQEHPLSGEDDSPIGTDFMLAPDGRTVHVLANGYPVNFWGMSSMPNEASDLIMTLILLSAVEVASRKYTAPQVDSNAVNTLADTEHYDLAGNFLRIHKPSR